MLAFFARLFDGSDFPPRWHCGDWTEPHGWLHIVSDLAIFAAYVTIPFVLVFFVSRRRDVPFSKLFWLFAAFIVFCGTSHLIEAVIFWNPIYRTAGLVKALTAIVSWATVAALIRVVPQALSFRSPEALAKEVQTRTRDLRESQAKLELANAELQKKSGEIEQFVYTISHDLKSPLVTLSGYLDALKEDLEAGDQDGVQDAIRRLDRASANMAQRIQELLELSRIGRVPHNPAALATRDKVSEVLDVLASEIDKADATVTVHEPLLPMFADPTHFTQVLENLVSNALKYGRGETENRVQISTEETDSHVILCVQDDGPGIPIEHQERVFGLFQRASVAADGSGVGLAIVAKIAERHGGRAWVTCPPSSGAQFRVSFLKGGAR